MDHSHDPDLSGLARLKEAHQKLREQIARVVVGQDKVVEQLMMAIFSRGHCILEGVPGLAKTLMVSTLAECLSLQFHRIQFTPDLMPSDITGTEVLHEDRGTGERELKYMPGPIFANIVLADEINRTPPKTQAALLEAMQEHQVTSGGNRHPAPDSRSCPRPGHTGPARTGSDQSAPRRTARPLALQDLRGLPVPRRRAPDLSPHDRPRRAQPGKRAAGERDSPAPVARAARA